MKVTCATCKHFYACGGCADQPYPEMGCLKGIWDGCEDPDSIYEIIDCDQFESKEDKL